MTPPLLGGDVAVVDRVFLGPFEVAVRFETEVLKLLDHVEGGGVRFLGLSDDG